MDLIIGREGRNQRVLKVDGESVPPDRRAAYLYARLQELEPKPTMWDMVCFATELINMTALMEPAFREVSKKLSAITYETHYIHGTDLSSCLTQSSTQQSVEKTLHPEKTGVEQELKSMELTSQFQVPPSKD